MQWHALKKLIRKDNSLALFNQIATDFRLNAGELPEQKLDVDVKQSHYHEHDFTGLIDACDEILSRRRTLQKPDNEADNKIIADYEVIDNGADRNNDKELGQ